MRPPSRYNAVRYLAALFLALGASAVVLLLVTQLHAPQAAVNATAEEGRGDVCKLGLNITCLGGFVNASGTV